MNKRQLAREYEEAVMRKLALTGLLDTTTVALWVWPSSSTTVGRAMALRTLTRLCDKGLVIKREGLYWANHPLWGLTAPGAKMVNAIIGVDVAKPMYDLSINEAHRKMWILKALATDVAAGHDVIGQAGIRAGIVGNAKMLDAVVAKEENGCYTLVGVVGIDRPSTGNIKRVADGWREGWEIRPLGEERAIRKVEREAKKLI